MENSKKYLNPLVYTLAGSAFFYMLYSIYKRFLKKKLCLMWSNNNPIPLSKKEAMRRANLIENVKYNLFLQLKEFPIYHLKKIYDGAISIQFDLNVLEDIFLDFSGSVLSVVINSKEISNNNRNNRIHLPKEYLRNHANNIYIRFENTFSNGDQGILYYTDEEDTVFNIIYLFRTHTFIQI
jgi:hypothetical protein